MPQHRAFIIEDSPVIRANLIDTLEELVPLDVVGWADNESEASNWMASHPDGWDLVIIDIFLRQGSGLGVLRSCRQRMPHCKLAVLSNYATPDMRMKCMELGADAVFDKSNEIDALIDYCARLPELPEQPEREAATGSSRS